MPGMVSSSEPTPYETIVVATGASRLGSKTTCMPLASVTRTAAFASGDGWADACGAGDCAGAACGTHTRAVRIPTRIRCKGRGDFGPGWHSYSGFSRKSNLGGG